MMKDEKEDFDQKMFEEHLVNLIINGMLPLRFVDEPAFVEYTKGKITKCILWFH